MTASLSEMYAAKPADYFDGARPDIIDLMPPNPHARVLEIGCGNGANGVLARKAGKAGQYCGIEIDPGAARLATDAVDSLYVGDAEAFDFGSLAPIDVAILSEVLEHLVDPWSLVAKLRAAMAPGGVVFASSPNIANAALLIDLIAQRFDYTDAGVMDRTHLRWFTPRTYARMFEGAGFETVEMKPMGRPGPKWRIANFLTFGRFEHLGHKQMLYIGRAGRA